MSKRSGNPAKRGWEPMVRDCRVEGAVGATYADVYRGRPEVVATETWANRLYNGFLWWFDDGAGHFSFKRNDRTAVRDWRHVQAIKNEVAGPDREAVEIYPPEDMLVDGANEYHLWVLPPGMLCSLGLGRREVGGEYDRYDRQAQLQGSPRPGARQRPWEPGLPTGLGSWRTHLAD